MRRVALLDVNLLVALTFPAHIHHDLAHDWFSEERRHGWATCPLTEHGFIRLAILEAAQSTVSALQSPETAFDYLRRFRASGHHSFWTDSLSITDSSVFGPGAVRGSNQLTDVYLLGLAHKMRGRLATFDQSISLGAVAGATRETLCVIPPAER
jgi:toxin-antitoxin system PIN domain toxin